MTNTDFPLEVASTLLERVERQDVLIQQLQTTLETACRTLAKMSQSQAVREDWEYPCEQAVKEAMAAIKASTLYWLPK